MATENSNEASSPQTTFWTSSGRTTSDPDWCSPHAPYTAADTWPIVALGAVTVVLSLVGNLFVLFIYNYRWRAAGATTTYVSCLAVSDLLTGLVSIPNDLIPFTFLSTRDPHLSVKFDVVCRVTGYLSHGFRWSSAFILFVIAVRRFLRLLVADKHFKLFTGSLASAQATTAPASGRLYTTLNSDRGAKLISCLMFSLAFVLTVPAAIVYTNAPENSCFFEFNANYSCYFYCGISDKLAESAVTKGFFLFAFVVFLATAAPMIALYAAVACRVRASERKQKIEDLETRSRKMSQNTRPLSKRCSSTIQRSQKRADAPGSSLQNSEPERDTSGGGRVASGASHYFPPISYAARFASTPELSAVEDSDQSCVTDFANWSTTSFQVTKTGSRKTRNTTFALMLISVAYVMSYLPYLSLSMFKRFGAGWCQSNEPFGVVVAAETLRRMYMISSAVNPLIYGFCNPTFRKVLWKLLARRRDVI